MPRITATRNPRFLGKFYTTKLHRCNFLKILNHPLLPAQRSSKFLEAASEILEIGREPELAFDGLPVPLRESSMCSRNKERGQTCVMRISPVKMRFTKF